MHLRPFLFQCLTGLALVGAAGFVGTSAHNILLGVGTHVAGKPLEQLHQLRVARKIGFNAVRDDFLWQFAETTKGSYHIPPSWDQYVNEARRLGIQPLVILDYGNKFYDGGNKPRSRQAIEGFVRYASFVVKHFAGRVHYFEIWNEWDTHAGGFPSGSARDYAKLFDAVFPVVKKVDPHATFLASASAGGRNEWYEQIAKLGVTGRADGVAVHPYVFPRRSIFQASRSTDEAERSVEQVINIETVMRRFSGGKTIPIYVTEIGWPTSKNASGVTQQVAALLAEHMLLMFSSLPYVRGVWWYDLVDDGSDDTLSRDRFGLLQQDYALKPAAFAIQSIASLIKNNELTLNPATNLAAALVVLNLGSPAQTSVIAWDTDSTKQEDREFSPGYDISCDVAQKVVPASRGANASNLQLTPTPAIFTYHDGNCVRVSLVQRTSPQQ